MEDLLPILFFVLISIISALGNKKKKRRPSPKTQKSGKSILEDLLRDISKEAPRPTPKTVPEETLEQYEPVAAPTPTPVKSVSKNRLLERNYKFKSSQEGNSSIRDKISQYKTKNTIKSTDLTKKQDRKANKLDFDLKKAVVYSEILNRKYI